MFSESYVLFAVGNVKSIFRKEYPNCWTAPFSSCSEDLIEAPSYTEISGVMLGMVVFGILAGFLGRRICSISTVAVMTVGAWLITSSMGSDDRSLTIWYTVAVAIFGMGVGGEYPISASIAAEQAAEKLAKQSLEPPVDGGEHPATNRGFSVVMTFSMQGVGQWVNIVVILLLMWLSGQTGADYDPASLELVWRVQYGIGAAIVTAVVVCRLMYTKESSAWKEAQASQASHPVQYDQPKEVALFVHYWPRLIGTAIAWCVWDVVFYGNKLFQGKFIKIIEGNAGAEPTLYSLFQYTFINNSIALVGYWCSAYVIDWPSVGRLKLQILGFFMVTWAFFFCGHYYETLTQGHNIRYFQMMYYMTSFFGQFGPNCTTFLLASELYPTEVRTLAHGVSATTGKLGALVASIYFSNPELSNSSIFTICGWCGLIGLTVTIIFVCDVTTLDSRHIDLQWRAIREGNPEGYTGPARHRKYHSWFELWVLRKNVLSDTDMYANLGEPGTAIQLDEVGEGESNLFESETNPSATDV